MASSGKEEMGFFCSAGVPIKKRKFPFVRPGSPPQQEPSCVLSLENKSASPFRESSPNACVGTSFLGKPNGSSVIKVEKEIPADTNVDLARCDVSLCSSKPQASIPTVVVEPLGTVDKPFIAAGQNMVRMNKLDLALNETSKADIETSSLGKSSASKNSVVKIESGVLPNTDVKLVALGVNLPSGIPQAVTTSFILESLDNDRKDTSFVAGGQKSIGFTKIDSAHDESSNAGDEKSSPRKSDTIKNLALEIEKGISADKNVDLVSVNLSTGKPRALIPSSISESKDAVDIKENPFIVPLQNVTASKLQVGSSCTAELFGTNTELSLGLWEPLVPARMVGPHSNGSNNPSSAASSTQDKCADRCEGGDLKAYSADRSNWDLNTSMEAWENSVGDGDSPKFVGPGDLKMSGLMWGVEPLVRTNATPGVVSDATKQTLRVVDRISAMPSLNGQCRSENTLNLSLFTHAPSSFIKEDTTASAKVDFGKVLPNLKMVEGSVSTASTFSVGCGAVKSEPFDENAKHGSPKGRLVGISDYVNRGLVDNRCTTQLVSPPNVVTEEVVESIAVKSEPVREDNEKKQVTSQISVEKVAQCQENDSSAGMTAEPKKSCPSDLNVCSELSIIGNVSNQLKYSSYKDVDNDNNHGSCKVVDKADTETTFAPMEHDIEESNACEGMIHSGVPESAKGDHRASHSRYIESFESHEQNINVLADILEEDSFGLGFEEVAHKETEGRRGGREDEYEDGELREALGRLGAEVPVKGKEVEKFIPDNCDNKVSKIVDFPVGCSTAPAPGGDDGKVEDHGETNDDHIKECADFSNKEADQVIDRDWSLQESSTVEEAASRADEKTSIMTTRGRQSDVSGRNDVVKDHDKEELSDGSINGGQHNETTVNQITSADIKGADTTEKDGPTLLKTDSFVNDKDVAKDANSGGSRSRIINLSRASNVTSPRRFIPDRPLLSTTGKERYAKFEGERMDLRRNRDELYSDGPRRYDKDRFQDQPFRNNRMNFVRGRGRSFRQRSEWDSDRNFGEENFNGRDDYRFSRHKRGSAGGDAEVEGNDFDFAPTRALGMSRVERKPMSEEVRSFRYPSSRKHSPGGRDGTGTRDDGNNFVRRILGNGNPRRCSTEHDNSIGTRHGEKFIRGLPEDVKDSVFVRRQPTNGELDLSGVQRRGPNRIRSKSPHRSRTRSPRPWSSPRKRSPDDFDVRLYRMETKSHNRPCYTEEIVHRRCDSPPYGARSSNALTFTDSGRVGQLRSANSNWRRPLDRVLPRSTRRFDIEPRERTDDDEFVRVPLRSGRFSGGDERVDERRKCGDRRGFMCSFRPSFSGADGESLHYHADGGPGSSRMCAEADSEFIERRNFREREFDGRIRSKPGIASSRVRNTEEEGNYRHGEQLWQDDGFDDVSPLKRRRF